MCVFKCGLYTIMNFYHDLCESIISRLPATCFDQTKAPRQPPKHARQDDADCRLSCLSVELLESAESASCVAEIRLLEMHDKMVKMMVWMTTGQVDSHIAGRFSSRRVCPAPVEVQPVL